MSVCGECKYFYWANTIKETGVCKRYPPTVVFTEPFIESVYPDLEFDEDACGEYVEKEKK